MLELARIDSGKEELREIFVDLENEEYSVIPVFEQDYPANAFDEDKKNALDAGMNGHLSKPIEIKKLVDVLRDYL